jgi:putative SOS response-associated peptidase YedK
MAGWGLVPFWLKPEDLSKQPYSTINARSDRIVTAPTYREPFAFAGVYDVWKADGKSAITSYSIVTTPAAPSPRPTLGRRATTFGR